MALVVDGGAIGVAQRQAVQDDGLLTGAVEFEIAVGGRAAEFVDYAVAAFVVDGHAGAADAHGDAVAGLGDGRGLAVVDNLNRAMESHRPHIIDVCEVGVCGFNCVLAGSIVRLVVVRIVLLQQVDDYLLGFAAGREDQRQSREQQKYLLHYESVLVTRS